MDGHKPPLSPGCNDIEDSNPLDLNAQVDKNIDVDTYKFMQNPAKWFVGKVKQLIGGAK